MIASAAGKVKCIIPSHGIPRTSEGYKVKVEVDINNSLNMGVLVNTLNKGKVFIEFIYIRLPDSFCVNYRRIGYERYDCSFPTLIEEEMQKLIMSEKVTKCLYCHLQYMKKGYKREHRKHKCKFQTKLQVLLYSRKHL